MGGRAWSQEEQEHVAELFHQGLRGEELRAAHGNRFGTVRAIHPLENAVYYKEFARLRYAKLQSSPATTSGGVEWEPTSGSLKSIDIRTLDEAMGYADLDPSDWNVDALRLKPYQTAQKLRRGCSEPGCKGGFDETVKIQMMAMEAKLSPRFGRTSIRRLLAEMGKDVRKQVDGLPVVTPANTSGEGFLLEISAPDLHLGKYAYAPETGDTQNLESAKDRFRTAVRTILAEAMRFGPIAQILFPTGNDFLHVDADGRNTTANTPQDVHGRWVELMREGRLLLSQVIREDLLPVAPVDVLSIPGNHARASEWALGEMLALEFETVEHVEIDNEPLLRKYYPWGKVLLGFTHGKDEKWATLPAIMAREAAEAWGHAVYREWHIGDQHRRHITLDENQEVPIRMIPSLSGIDAWHSMKGYSCTPGAEGFLWRADGPGPVIPYTLPRRPMSDQFTGPKIDRSF